MSRASSPPLTPWLSLHKRFATSHYWRDRLFSCGIGAALLSLFAWLVGAGLTWHLGFIAAGAALGFLRPLRSSQDWALHWLDSHWGLSYRTALESQESQGQEAQDAYGLRAALQQRVERAAKNLERPSIQPWWLPLFAIAFGLLLLPQVPWSGTSPFATTPPADGGEALVAEEEDDGQEVAAQEDALTSEGERPAAADALSSDAADAAGSPAEAGQGSTSTSASAPESDTPLDRDALENFMRSLPEEEPPEEGAEEATEEGRAPAEGEGEAGEPSRSREAAGQEGEGDTSEETGEGEAGAEAGQEGEGEEGSEPGEGESGAQEGEGNEGDEAGAEAGEDGEGDEAAAQEGGAISPEAGGAEEGGMPEEGEGGDLGQGAGAEGSAELEGFYEELERQEERLEFVPGQQEGGATSVSGVVRLPGGGEAGGPAGSAAGSYERGLERAITEGRIPVEYQEVLRDYFR
jgi:hypothetical protein